MQGENKKGTCIKQKRLFKVLWQRLTMTKNWDGVFRYVETNAGGPWNHKAGCKNSSLVFLDAARQVGRPYKALFIEKNAALANDLKEAIPEDCREHASVVNADNRRALRSLAGEIPSGSFGLAYFDPNGYAARGGYHHAEVMDFARQTRYRTRFDLLLSLSVTAAKRIEGCDDKHPDLNMPDTRRMYEDLLQARSFSLVAPGLNIPGMGSFLMLLLTDCDKGLSGWEDFVSCLDPRHEDILLHKRQVIPSQKELF